MVIGFTQRRQTVPESIFPGENLILLIDVATQRVSEREYEILYQLHPIGTATVVGFNDFETLNEDARFGFSDDGIIGELNLLPPGESVITPVRTDIRNDFIPELEECYTIQISPVDTLGFRELFTCNDDSTNATNYFCRHTICIEDNDEPFVVGFVETVYTVSEGAGSVEVCVNLTQPQLDILEEYVVVDVIDFSSSLYIPADVTLASELLMYP